jgi:hypothetical protein
MIQNWGPYGKGLCHATSVVQGSFGAAASFHVPIALRETLTANFILHSP